MTTIKLRDLAGTELARQIAVESGAYSHGYWRQALHQGINITPERLEKIKAYLSTKREVEELRHALTMEALDNIEKQLTDL